MTDILQWITILAAGGSMAYYALYRDKKEHAEKLRSGQSDLATQGSLFAEKKAETQKQELTHA